MPTTDPARPEVADSDNVAALLSRPRDQRVREYKYRFAQATVFGLPVLGLQYFGHALGGPEAGKWVGILQALLAGWVMYVGAAGMLFEGVLVARRRGLTADLLIAFTAIALYVGSLPSVAHALVAGAALYAICFHISVVIVMLWSAFQWLRLSRLSRRQAE